MPIPGIDALGLAHPKFRVGYLIDALPQGSAIGVFDDPTCFGRAIKKVRTVLNSGIVVAVRAHLRWHKDHIFPQLSTIRGRIIEWQALAVEYPHIQIYISPSCEYKQGTTREQLQNAINMILDLAPNCIPVQSPLPGAVTLPGVITERHHERNAGENAIASTDGKSAFDTDITSWINSNRKAKIVFLWAPRCNLRQSGSFIPPKDRETPPGLAYLRHLYSLHLPPPSEMPQPQFEGRIEALSKKTLYKTMAEDGVQENPPPLKDPRANKPMFVCPEKQKFVQIIARNGRQIGRFAYYGAFKGGGYRYYSGGVGGSGITAFALTNRAFAVSGSSWIGFRVAGKTYWGAHAAFRAPYFYW